MKNSGLNVNLHASPRSALDALIQSVHATIAVRRGITKQNLESRTNDTAIYAWGASLNFAVTGNASRFFGEGWSIPEPQYCWTNGTSAELNLAVLPLEGTDLILTTRLTPFVSTKTTAQLVRVFVNDSPTGQWLVHGCGQQHAVVFNRHFAGKNTLKIRFDLPRAFSPQAQGLSEDSRVLALAFHTLSLHPINPPGLGPSAS